MRGILLNSIATCVALLVCAGAQAQAYGTSYRSTVTRLIFYSNFDTSGGGSAPSGDVTFTLTFVNNQPPITTPMTCYGFYIRGTDPGYKTLLTAILTAYQSGAPIIVQAFGPPSTPYWVGNKSSYCLVDDIQY
jgi:hypothetical protein